MEACSTKRLGDISAMIGNTPLLAIRFRYRGSLRCLYAKAEWYNLTGSIKDRVVFHILQKAVCSGALRPGDVLVEATSGNTGISLSALGRLLGHSVELFMPDWMSDERKNLLRSYGARVRLVSRDEGGFIGSVRRAREAGVQPGFFLPGQFTNPDNIEAHFLTTGDEIARQMARAGARPDAVVAGVGTGGTVMGIGRRLRRDNSSVRVYPLEPANSPILSTGVCSGSHRIQGISDEFVLDILSLRELDEVLQVDDGDAIAMARMLSQTLGLGVGISSGANFLGAVLAQERLGPRAAVVTVFSDDNKKYLSTDYSREQTPQPGWLSPDIELLGVRALPAVQRTGAYAWH